LSEIHVPVLLLQGEQDQMVPFLHWEWLANNISGIEAQLLAEDGHLTIAAARISIVHEWLLSKMQ
jgi:pimeloyl-ACP methyl ester carboxylesterase